MKNKLIKTISIISLILCSVSMIGCREKTLSTADEENINVKTKTSSDGGLSNLTK